jgi:hypothetical protein
MSMPMTQIMNTQGARKEHRHECHRQPPSAFRASIRALFTKARMSSSKAERSDSGQLSSLRFMAAAASNCESANSSSNSWRSSGCRRVEEIWV